MAVGLQYGLALSWIFWHLHLDLDNYLARYGLSLLREINHFQLVWGFFLII